HTLAAGEAATLGGPAQRYFFFCRQQACTANFTQVYPGDIMVRGGIAIGRGRTAFCRSWRSNFCRLFSGGSFLSTTDLDFWHPPPPHVKNAEQPGCLPRLEIATRLFMEDK
ncbi:MAG: hypothetical protein V2I48_13920, partial [Xanthomonadales bacterium]|nr:hypothetical protein [Xanthomonadales bacterium]